MATSDYAARIAEIHFELGIPPEYAASRQLTLQPEVPMAALVEIGVDYAGRPRQLTAEAATAWHHLQSAARKDGQDLLLLSAFRSVNYQRGIVERKRSQGRSWEEIFHLSAAPGYSEHHTGRAIDLGTPGSPPFEIGFAETTAFAWLQQHAPTLGWRMSFPAHNPHRIAYEPWHWFFLGPPRPTPDLAR